VVRSKDHITRIAQSAGCGLENRDTFLSRDGDFSLCHSFQPALGFTQLFVHWVPRVLFTGLRWGDDTEMYYHVLGD
jgi:hypothetical protein